MSYLNARIAKDLSDQAMMALPDSLSTEISDAAAEGRTYVLIRDLEEKYGDDITGKLFQLGFNVESMYNRDRHHKIDWSKGDDG